MADDRAAREEKVLEAVRRWLPDLRPGAVIEIAAREPTEGNPSMFCVTNTPVSAFVCRRGGGR